MLSVLSRASSLVTDLPFGQPTSTQDGMGYQRYTATEEEHESHVT